MSVFVEAIDAMENVKNANCVVNFFLYPIDKTWAVCIVQNVMANAHVSKEVGAEASNIFWNWK